MPLCNVNIPAAFRLYQSKSIPRAKPRRFLSIRTPRYPPGSMRRLSHYTFLSGHTRTGTPTDIVLCCEKRFQCSEVYVTFSGLPVSSGINKFTKTIIHIDNLFLRRLGEDEIWREGAADRKLWKERTERVARQYFT